VDIRSSRDNRLSQTRIAELAVVDQGQPGLSDQFLNGFVGPQR
jgi:hypothetical protein